MANPFFSGNYGSALGSTANAAQIIAQAGARRGEMFQNLGKIAATTLDKFRKAKQEKEREENFVNMAKGLSVETFAPFGVKSEDEKNAFIQSIKKAGPREDALGLFQMTEALKQNQLQQQKNLGQQQFTNLMLGTTPANVPPTDSSIRDAFAREKAMADARGAAATTSPEAFRQRVVQNQNNLNPQAQQMALNRFMQLQQAQAQKDAAQTAFQQEMAMKGLQLTPGQEAIDKEFAKTIMEFNEADVRKGLAQLSEANNALGGSNTLTGPLVSLLPNFFADRVNPKAAEVREAVEEVVQRNLRLVLGPAFTEKEGERLISRAYNPKLDEKENKKRVGRLMESIQKAMDEKLNQRDYFQQNGTLMGYDYKPISIGSIENNFNNTGDTEASAEELAELERLQKLMQQRTRNINANQ